ncbi:TIM protein, partial [Glaucidium brasilianum]|nr:TIM protein [Glaucidium brasilianum]
NKKAFVELLFWKNPAAVREMTEGYGSLREDEGAGRGRVPPWTPQEEQELRELYWKYKEVEGTGATRGGGQRDPRGGLSLQPPPAPPGEDVVAAIMAELRAPGRTRRQVVKQLVRL